MRECRRAENADYNIAALRKLTDLSIELATLIVETARSAATTETPAISKTPRQRRRRPFRGVRRAAL